MEKSLSPQGREREDYTARTKTTNASRYRLQFAPTHPGIEALKWFAIPAYDDVR
jgi:hypothetical protein